MTLHRRHLLIATCALIAAVAFPVLKGTPQEYLAALGQTGTKVFPINPGDKLEF